MSKGCWYELHIEVIEVNSQPNDVFMSWNSVGLDLCHFVSHVQNQDGVRSPDCFFLGAHTEQTARGPQGEIRWIGQKVLWVRFGYCTFLSISPLDQQNCLLTLVETLDKMCTSNQSWGQVLDKGSGDESLTGKWTPEIAAPRPCQDGGHVVRLASKDFVYAPRKTLEIYAFR